MRSLSMFYLAQLQFAHPGGGKGRAMRAGDWEGAFDEARVAEEAAAARHEERAALLRARLESGLRKARSSDRLHLLIASLCQNEYCVSSWQPCHSILQSKV